MNFLAHIFLSQQPPELLVGNFIGDFVKGRNFEHFPELVQKGIMLHREIDAFTDDNDIVRESKKRLVPKYRHYSAVIVDMFYDHFLAADWENLHSQPLGDFSQQTYTIINMYWDILPERAQYMLPYMIRHDWLKSYEKISGINRALGGLSQRSRFTSYMENAAQDLEEDYDSYRSEFNSFFPLIIDFTNKWKEAHAI